MSKGAEAKKEEGHSAPKAPAAAEPKATGKKGHIAAPGGCFCWGCKKEAHRFNFCDEHYDHFKFGLIKKSGEPVSDYEKKFEHYVAYKAKRGAQKVA